MPLFPNFTGTEFGQMILVERTVIEAIAPFRGGRTEDVLVAMACLRVARTLTRLYPQAVQAQLTPLFVAFMDGRTEALGTETAALDPLGFSRES